MLQFELKKIPAKLVIDKTWRKKLMWRKKKTKLDVFWELSETVRRKMCVTRTFFHNDLNQSYFTIKLFTPDTEKEIFYRKSFLSLRIGELKRPH